MALGDVLFIGSASMDLYFKVIVDVLAIALVAASG